MLYQLLYLLAGFMLLIKGADFLVRGSASLAKALGVSTLLIGLTVVSFGTSFPELVVNLFSAVGGSTELAVGNILGSNVANILLILGVVACMTPIGVGRGTVWKEIPLALLASIVLLLLGSDVVLGLNSTNVLSRLDGIILLLFFAIFLYYTYGVSRLKAHDGLAVEHMSTWKCAAYILAGLLGLVVGGKLIVDAASTMARVFGVGEHIIGVTVVALGTSLPELVTSVVAARKRHIDLAVGNVVGSNIFNVFFVLAATAVVSPLPFSILAMRDAIFAIGVSVLLFLALFIGKRHAIDRWQGVVFVGLYLLYIGWNVVESL